MLNQFKWKYSLIDQPAFHEIEEKIEKSLAFIEKTDQLLALSPDKQSGELAKLTTEMAELNHYSICGKNELKWEVQKNYANVFSLALVGLELLFEDYKTKIRHQFRPKKREQVNLDV